MSRVFISANVTGATFNRDSTYEGIESEVICAGLALRGGDGDADSYM